MKRLSIIIFIILACFAIAQEPPVLPAFFYGDATVNGQDVPVQSIIVAEIGGVHVGEIKIVDSGIYGHEQGQRKFGVSGSYSDMDKNIEFYLNLPGFEPIKAEETAVFETGAIDRLDLTFTGDEVPLPEDTGDDNSADKPSSSSSTPRKTGAPAIAPATSGGPSNKALFYYDKIGMNRQIDIEVGKDDIPFTLLQLILNGDKTEVRFRFELIGDVDVPKLDGVYHYVEIDAPLISEDDVNTAIIRFRVANEWLLNYDASKVTLYRYHDGWEPLNTVEAGSDARFHYYRAQTPGFSYFAIVSEENKPVPETTIIESTEQPKIGDVPVSTPKVPAEKDEKSNKVTGMLIKDDDGKTNPLGLAIVIVGIIAIALVAYHFIGKR